ncbi:MAG: Acyl dehydratase [Frankiales bacterium]|jgi:acyl dehydratase|nr:Acyl dehydratase [Frankiales bacterium]
MPGLEVTVDQLRELGETELGTSDWLLVDQERINGFAEATEDHQWIHVDPARAAEGPFGTTIAHGYLTLSLLPRLLDELLIVTDQVRGTNYGIDRARFTSPVPVGSKVRLSGRLMHVAPRPDGGLQYKVAVQMEVRDHDRPALVAEAIYLTYGA